MSTSKVLTSEQKSLIANCVAVLRQGIALLEKIDDHLMTKCETSDKSSVGAHFRHNLDFVENVLRGLRTGKIDYNRRERNYRVETNREYAISRFRAAIVKLELLTAETLENPVAVRSETVENLWCESGALRELEFLRSHTIHHYALIQSKLESSGFAVPRDFGVAPSTLEFWQSRSA